MVSNTNHSKFNKTNINVNMDFIQINIELCTRTGWLNYNYVMMSQMASQITSLPIVYLAVYLGADQRKHQSSASLAFVRGIHRGPVNSPHKGQ